jgi:HEAT repeat protein
MAKKQKLSTSEWIAQLENDPAYLAKRKELEQESIRNQVAFARDAAPILADLRDAGLHLNELSDLKFKSVDFRPQLHILLEWIPRISNWSVKEELIRSLARKEAKPKAAPLLIKEFLKEPRPANESANARWVIGNSLDVVADDSVYKEMVEIAQDRRFGKGRQMVVRGLKNMRNPEVVDVLVGLLDDEIVTVHALSALRLMGATKARPEIQRFLTHENVYCRNEAKKAIEKFDKLEARKKRG